MAPTGVAVVVGLEAGFVVCLGLLLLGCFGCLRCFGCFGCFYRFVVQLVVWSFNGFGNDTLLFLVGILVGCKVLL